MSARPLRILAVTHFPPLPGGSARSCALLFRGIAARGHPVRALASITPETETYDADRRRSYPPDFSAERYPVPYFSVQQFDVKDFLRFQAIEHQGIRERLPSLIERFRPDVVVSAHETLGEAVVDVAHAHGLACALMLRGSPTWQIVADAYPPEYAARYLKLYADADLVIPVGDYMREGLAARGIDAAKLRHIPNLLDLSLFRPGPRNDALRDAYGIPRDAVVLLHASLMQSRKRPLDIVDSAALALPQQEDLIYVFLGGGERTAEIRAAVRERGVAENRALFVESVEYERMPDHIRMADMVALASAGEGVARVYLETQACGRTLISSDIPAGREVVDHGRTGLLFKTGDPADLAEQVLRAARDPEWRNRIGTAARERAQAHDIDRVVDQYIEAFESLRT